MKRKHHEIAGPSDNFRIRKPDHPNKRVRTWVFPRLPTELVRRISKFVVELTHTWFVEKVFPMLLQVQLRYPRVYDIQVTNNDAAFIPFAHLPYDSRHRRTHRFTRFEIANGQRYVIFQTIQEAGYWFIRIPIHLIHSLTENLR